MLNLPIRWIGKDSLFTGVFGRLFGGLLRRWGGRPVFRSQSTGLVGQLAEMMRAEPWCWLAITPEGTRSRRAAWRSGFYHLAREAGAPVGVAYIDYPAKELGLVSYVDLGGQPDADLAHIAELLAGHRGRHPEKESPIRFRDGVE